MLVLILLIIVIVEGVVIFNHRKVSSIKDDSISRSANKLDRLTEIAQRSIESNRGILDLVLKTNNENDNLIKVIGIISKEAEEFERAYSQMLDENLRLNREFYKKMVEGEDKSKTEE